MTEDPAAALAYLVEFQARLGGSSGQPARVNRWQSVLMLVRRVRQR